MLGKNVLVKIYLLKSAISMFIIIHLKISRNKNMINLIVWIANFHLVAPLAHTLGTKTTRASHKNDPLIDTSLQPMVYWKSSNLGKRSRLEALQVAAPSDHEACTLTRAAVCRNLRKAFSKEIYRKTRRHLPIVILRLSVVIPPNLIWELDWTSGPIGLLLLILEQRTGDQPCPVTTA